MKGVHTHRSPVLDLVPVLATWCNENILPTLFLTTPSNILSQTISGQIFVKTLLIVDEKVISMRQTGFHMHSFECTILNEKYAIPIKKQQLERAALVVAVHSHDSGTGGNTEIARCCVGSITYSSGHRLTHWNDMVIYRGHNIIRTHSLYWHYCHVPGRWGLLEISPHVGKTNEKL